MEYTTRIQILLVAVIFVLICMAINLLYQIAKYYKEKQAMTIITTKKTEYELLSLQTGVAYNLAYKIKTTEELIVFLENSVDIEVSLIIRNLSTLRQKYDVKNMDEDIKTISSKVFESFHGSVYTSSELIVTEDYLMRYIVEYTTTQMIKSASELNNTIYFESPLM